MIYINFFSFIIDNDNFEQANLCYAYTNDLTSEVRSGSQLWTCTDISK